MKKTILLICFLFFTLSQLTAQKLDSATLASPQKLHDYYLQKQKSRTKTGWILLGTGLASLPLGFYLLGQGFSDYPSVDVPPAITIAVLAYSVGAPIASVPFFVSAGSNKRQARLALKGEAVTMGNKMLYKSAYPALSVAISL